MVIKFLIGFLFLILLLCLVWWISRRCIIKSALLLNIFDISMSGIITATIIAELVTGYGFLAFMWENLETLFNIDIDVLYKLISHLKNLSQTSEDLKSLNIVIGNIYTHIKATENITAYLIEINSKDVGMDHQKFYELLEQFHTTRSMIKHI